MKGLFGCNAYAIDYADIIYDKPFNDAFKEKLEKVQYYAALIITGAIKGISRERLYKQLGLESLCNRRWYRKLVFFYKIVEGLAPSYLQSCLLLGNERAYNTRSSFKNTIKTFATRTSTFYTTFFPYCTKEWNQLNDDIKKIESIKKFKKMLIKIIRTKENSVFGVSDIYGVKLLTPIRLNFSRLNEHKFRHKFNDMINPCATAVLLLKQLFITSCVADFIQFKERSSLMVYIN